MKFCLIIQRSFRCCYTAFTGKNVTMLRTFGICSRNGHSFPSKEHWNYSTMPIQIQLYADLPSSVCII